MNTYEMYEFAKEQKSLFIEFPVDLEGNRLIALNPSKITPEIRDALISFVEGPEITKIMFYNRTLLERMYKEHKREQSS